MELTLLILKATALFLAAMGIACVYRRAPGHAHQAWTIAFAAILALPLLAVLLPPLDVPVPSRWSSKPPAAPPAAPLRSAPPDAPLGRIDRAADAAVPAAASSESRDYFRPRRSFVWPAATAMAKGLWLAGTLASLLMIALSLWRVRRLSALAEEMRDPIWDRSAAAIGRRVGLRYSVRVVLSEQIETPMAGGFGRPTVFLPMSAVGWSAERRSVVLAHELVHLARRDPLRQVAIRLTLAVYWFNPLAWMAARSAALACEDACDESVVRLGIRPSSYARVLLELAESAGRSRMALAALPIVRRSRLERRLVTILNTSARPASAHRLRLLAFTCAALTVALAAAHPTASVTPATVVVADPDAVRQVGQSGPPLAPPTGSSLALRPASSDRAPSASHLTPASVERTIPKSRSESACASNLFLGGSGDKVSETLRRGGMVVGEQVEPHGFTRVLQKSFGDLRVCLFAEAAGASTTPSDIVAQAARVILEVQQRGTIQQLELKPASAGSAEMAWRLNGIAAPTDATVDRWRHHLLSVLDTTWELAQLHGQARTLAWDDHDRRATELEDRRQQELTQLRRAIEENARSAEPASDKPVSLAPAEMSPAAADQVERFPAAMAVIQ
jgi:beta-lactamase regulating signal transducer with metallopeptidase domain